MGNEPSRPLNYSRISRALPPLAPQYGSNENSEWVDKGAKAFASEGDRDQFIYALISLLTSNGILNLSTHDVKLFFSRRECSLPPPEPTNNTPSPSSSSNKPAGWRSLIPSSPAEPDDGTRLLATLVAIDEKGVIRVKISSEKDGRDVAEAFREFKKDVECKLEKLLREVPSGVAVNALKAEQGEEVSRRMGGQDIGSGMQREREVVDAPPAYGDGEGDVKKR